MMMHNQPATGKVNNINTGPVNNEDIENNGNIDENSKGNFNEFNSTNSQDIINNENASEDSAGMETREEEIIEEYITEEQEQADGEEIKEENNNTGQNDSQNIDFSSSADFRIEVDLNRQKVLVYHKDSLLSEWVCSGGTEEKSTPRGEFKTTQKGEYFWSDKYNMGAYYWIRFYDDYLFHSVPFDKDNNMIQEESDKLGSPASHGCIRLEVENARWLYEMLPLGVKVLIY